MVDERGEVVVVVVEGCGKVVVLFVGVGELFGY